MALVEPTIARWLRPGTVQADPPALHRIRGMIAGTEDGMVPQVMRGMAAACPGSTFTAVKGAGHLPNIEQPARFDAALDALLARPSGPA